MAQQVTVLLTDDLDGGEADETILFTLDGITYEIDLSTGNAAQLRKDIGPWVEHARKTTGDGSPQRRGRGARAHAASVRVWARAAGYQVSDRGRIPPRIVDEYDAAH